MCVQMWRRRSKGTTGCSQSQPTSSLPTTTWWSCPDKWHLSRSRDSSPSNSPRRILEKSPLLTASSLTSKCTQQIVSTAMLSHYIVHASSKIRRKLYSTDVLMLACQIKDIRTHLAAQGLCLCRVELLKPSFCPGVKSSIVKLRSIGLLALSWKHKILLQWGDQQFVCGPGRFRILYVVEGRYWRAK